MSRRSAFKINQRVREGIQGQRRVRAHVLATQTEKVAKLVAAHLESLVTEEVSRELDRRGYRKEAFGYHDVEDLYTDEKADYGVGYTDADEGALSQRNRTGAVDEGREGHREGSGETSGLQGSDWQTDPEIEGLMEEEGGVVVEGQTCPACLRGQVVQDSYWPGRIMCSGCNSNWDKVGA